MPLTHHGTWNHENYQKPDGCLKLTMEPGTILNQKPQGWVYQGTVNYV